MANELPDFIAGTRDPEVIERAIQWLTRSALGQVGNGIPWALTQYDGTGTANYLSSADTTNGIGFLGSSQNATYQLEIRNSGMNITGAPTLNAFTVGSVLFVGASKVMAQDNSNFFWDDTNNRLGVGNNTPQQRLHVAGDGQVSTFFGAGGAPDATHAIKVSGLAYVTARMGVGAAADATITLLVTGTANITGDFTVATNKFTVASATGNTVVAGTLDVTGNVAVNTNKFTVTASSGNTLVAGTLNVAGNITHDTSLLTTDVTNDKVSIGAAAASTMSMLEVAGAIRATNTTGAATAGEGFSLSYNPATNFGILRCVTGAGTYEDALIDGLSVDLRASNVSTLKIDGTGVGFFATGPVAQQTSPATVAEGTADATYGTAERDSINEHSVAINEIIAILEAYGLSA